jgi:N-dimethylarginine dimethylaminohydrolase
VSYAINPWMQPEAWANNPTTGKRRAQTAWNDLTAALRQNGFTLHLIPGVPGLPDLVFPANAAVVLNGRALLARFRCPERRGEEPVLRKYFEELTRRGFVHDVHVLPEGVFQEGAGDCIWDEHRQLFWAGYGQRSQVQAIPYIRALFGQEVVALELATPHYYHLDTCFLPLPGGEVLYFPGAFTVESQAEIAARVPLDKLIAATAEEAASFCLNAVAAGRELVMATPPARLRSILEERGYRCTGVDLSPFMMAGGAAYCMTLRLDRRSQTADRVAAA